MFKVGKKEQTTYPGIVEFGLDADIVAFLFILCTKDLEFCRLQRANGRVVSIMLGCR